MIRQDQFLREVLTHARAAQHSITPGIGLAEIIEAIEARLPMLKPVVYENHDLSSGLSWDGNIICGNAKSIRAVKLALHDAENVRTFWRPAHLRMQEELNIRRS